MKFLDERIARTPGHKLRELLKSGQLILGGGAHDALSARIVQEAGYPLCVVTGAGVSMCRGYPDVGFVTLEEMVANARYIAEAVRIPVVVDADNGYGNALNVMRTVREFERAGVAGIHIEDQVWPKRCGHMVGKRLIPKEEMAGKIRAALDARRDEDFMIIARCDAVMVEGLDKTLERGEAYLEAGADMLFFEMRESQDEIKAMAERFRGRIPLHYNHSPSGMVPRLHVDEIHALGFSTACFYVHALMAACKTMREVLTEIRASGNSLSVWDRMVGFEEFWALCRLPEIRELEKKYGV
ncbi:MAG TPA: isocitrate lyase/PEP mutase family protein [Casimicrobiaceae bacterium]|jgi:2-methylisocitrate lyase-like PEP mutase family enzyme|nr:isocitrate lyase/PEP mutase family protein [Casimicrobiaceae bacterium]